MHAKKAQHGRRTRRLRLAALCGLLAGLALAAAVYGYSSAMHMAGGQDAALQPASAQPAGQGAAQSAAWDTLAYQRTAQPTVLRTAAGATAMDFRLAGLPANGRVELSYFDQALFLGDSLTQGLQIYSTGLPNAMYCAYRGVGPNAVVNNTACKRVDGVEEIPLEAIRALQPPVIYILLGTNVLTRDTAYDSFLAYYAAMLDLLREAVPGVTIYIQSITPVRPEVRQEGNHAGMYRERFMQVNNELAALAVEKGCYFINLWEALADENGDLNAAYAQQDGYHLKPVGYAAWVEYLRTHTAPGAGAA